MKRLLLLVAIVLLCFSAYSQREGIEVDREWAEAIKPYFEHLDKGRVPHGILLDFGMEFTNVPAYTGTSAHTTKFI